ncbi:MAG: hypothetical protein J6T68_04740, partial [Candidatus Methanomethylophilaceae archaeon]|nr:hypothetical protein [Candidatus Methanomethylophilaceae archaeon]
FFMAIWAQSSDNKDRVLPGVLRYTIPTAILTSICAVAIYSIVYYLDPELIGFHYDSWEPQDDWEGIDLQQRLASASMIMFLGITGALQLLVVQPYTKWLGVDNPRRECRDPKPVILCILLVVTAVAFYNIPFLLGLMKIPHLTFETQAVIVFISFVWLIVHHYFVTLRPMNYINDFVESHYKKTFEKRREKENARALSGEDEKWLRM